MNFPNVKCPYCFKEIKYNNVVFRLVSGSMGTDPYVKAFEEGKKHIAGDENYRYINEDFVYEDTMYTSIGDIEVDDDKGITAISNPDESSSGQILERCCPYCHSVLPADYGKSDVKFIAVIGAPSSGKSTLIASMHNNMISGDEGYYWTEGSENGSLSALAQSLRTATRTQDRKDIATRVVQGPFYYRFQCSDKDGKEKSSDIVFFDVPGEYFQDARRMRTELRNYLNNADGIIFVINAGEAAERFELESQISELRKKLR